MENIISGNSKSGQLAPGARQPARAGLAAFVGTMIEWYDFYIYGTAAALVFGQLFFPPGDPFLSRMAALGTFAVGFFARPSAASSSATWETGWAAKSPWSSP
ncbi:hypothetical protein [Chromobacterium sp. Beijing]|uniref:hypothetical protein n=1 Tax=Chromobacterium sp. Beijing TaxID=2735795 RepID=UPI001F351E53|nr:hypothetical protein [Chromobacterium sp. Beijing]